MSTHLRANLWLLIATLLLCSVVYPGVLWVIARVGFPNAAEGSLISQDGKTFTGAGKPGGSRLIAQPFTDPRYFQPRPSAASYNAAVSSASNWAASNPLLRDRVARQLAPIARHKDGRSVGPDVDRWFAQQTANDAQKPVAERFVVRWAQEHPAVAEQWLKDNVDAAASLLNLDVEVVKKSPGDQVPVFFARFASRHPGCWPTTEEVKTADGKTAKQLKAVKDGSDVQAYLFDPWLQAHPDVELVRVPADRVMASGSGLDPHITRDNALSQLDDVAAAWAKKTGRDPGSVTSDVRRLIDEHAEAPLGGLVGVPIVNVLELNLSLRNHFDAASMARQ